MKSQEAPKTREMAAVFDKITQRSCLLLDSEFSKNQLLSLRNLKRVFSIDMSSVNALDVTLYSNIVVTERALTAFLEKTKAEE